MSVSGTPGGDGPWPNAAIIKRNETSGEEGVWIQEGARGCTSHITQNHHHTANLNQASHGPGTAPVLSKD